MSLPSRSESEKLLGEYIQNENLINHCEMVAQAMEAYATHLEKSEKEVEEWWTAGLLHDLDWEKYPDEHPNKAIDVILPKHGYPQNIIDAIAAHAPERTGKKPETEIERYLYACDELSGFMNAVSLMRPNKFEDMKVKSVTKNLKDAKFAANIPREDVKKGAELIGKELRDHIAFLIDVYRT
ncbi:HD domain-containing protein [Gracilimonas sp.]|uniref:HD domain-containing protein n=1 Tax=Gracilimonas sp. TaxID=1974203 RepID=UPI002870C1BE|nr:HDIG domain-containing protein [Gracilimonas sp.]